MTDIYGYMTKEAFNSLVSGVNPSRNFTVCRNRLADVEDMVRVKFTKAGPTSTDVLWDALSADEQELMSEHAYPPANVEELKRKALMLEERARACLAVVEKITTVLAMEFD